MYLVFSDLEYELTKSLDGAVEGGSGFIVHKATLRPLSGCACACFRSEVNFGLTRHLGHVGKRQDAKRLLELSGGCDVRG